MHVIVDADTTGHGLRCAAVVSALAILAAACAPRPVHEMKMTPLSDMPAEMSMAPEDVRSAYQFASANPQVSMNVPCYCGCVSLGHRSNFDCYVESVDVDRSVKYDRHALSCATCVDITQDSMRMWSEGKDVPEIRAYVDATYAHLGHPTMP